MLQAQADAEVLARAEQQPRADEFTELERGAEFAVAVDPPPREQVPAEARLQIGHRARAGFFQAEDGCHAEVPQLLVLGVLARVPVRYGADAIRRHVPGVAELPAA